MKTRLTVLLLALAIAGVPAVATSTPTLAAGRTCGVHYLPPTPPPPACKSSTTPTPVHGRTTQPLRDL